MNVARFLQQQQHDFTLRRDDSAPSRRSSSEAFLKRRPQTSSAASPGLQERRPPRSMFSRGHSATSSEAVSRTVTQSPVPEQRPPLLRPGTSPAASRAHPAPRIVQPDEREQHRVALDDAWQRADRLGSRAQRFEERSHALLAHISTRAVSEIQLTEASERMRLALDASDGLLHVVAAMHVEERRLTDGLRRQAVRPATVRDSAIVRALTAAQHRVADLERRFVVPAEDQHDHLHLTVVPAGAQQAPRLMPQILPRGAPLRRDA